MQIIKSDIDPAQVSVSSSIWLASFGIQNTKRQATVESAVSGAEFVAMKQAMEVSQGLRYKLRMMGVPICRILRLTTLNSLL